MLLLLLTSCNASSTLYPFLSIKYAIINDVDLDFPAKLFYLIIIFIIIITVIKIKIIILIKIEIIYQWTKIF